MNPRMLAISSVSFALFLGMPGMGETSMRDNDRVRGAEWQPERAVTQNLPSPRYRSSGEDRYHSSRDQFRRTPDQYSREFNRSQRRSDRGRMLVGTLLGFQGEYAVVNTREGDRQRLHVGKSTLMDAGIERGDNVIAKVRPDGHAIAIRKDRGRRGEHFVQPGAPENRNVARSADNRRRALQLMGTLLHFQDDYVVVNTRDGDRQRLHVSDKTLLDAGMERGDRIIAQVRPDGHAIAIRKDRGRRGEHFVQPGAPEGGFGYEDRFRSRNDRHFYQDDYGRNQQRSDHGRYRP